METGTEKENPMSGELILVNRKDTTRLLEIYVKRSLSLNDGKKLLNEIHGSTKQRKWVTMPERLKKYRRSSSVPSIHLDPRVSDGAIGMFSAVETPEAPEAANDTPEKIPEVRKKKKKKTKPSLWKSFIGLFSRRGSEDKDEEQDSASEITDFIPSLEASDPHAGCLPPIAHSDMPRKKSFKRSKFSRRKLSFRKSIRRDPRRNTRKEESLVDITTVSPPMPVEPTDDYYEKVSEEMKKIVDEVKEKEKPLTDEEVINRIIILTKQQGDAIDEKLRENPTLCNFFQKMSYSSFRQLVDTYLEAEATPTEGNQSAVPHTAPELVKLAFTLDFTARIAGLSRQNIGHITGLGTRYLEDRFAYQQACTDHPWSDNEELSD